MVWAAETIVWVVQTMFSQNNSVPVGKQWFGLPKQCLAYRNPVLAMPNHGLGSLTVVWVSETMVRVRETGSGCPALW